MLKAVRSLFSHRRLCHHSLYPGQHRSQLASGQVGVWNRIVTCSYPKRRLCLLRLSTEMSGVSFVSMMKRHWLMVYSLKPCQTPSFSLSFSLLSAYISMFFAFGVLLSKTSVLVLWGCECIPFFGNASRYFQAASTYLNGEIFIITFSNKFFQ